MKMHSANELINYFKLLVYKHLFIIYLFYGVLNTLLYYFIDHLTLSG